MPFRNSNLPNGENYWLANLSSSTLGLMLLRMN